ncbi:MAG: hypothetical protein P8X74_13280 [Reinekea sp.]
MDRINWPCNSTDHYYNQACQENGRHTSWPEAGQPSAGAPARGASGSHPVPGQPQPYQDLNPLPQIPPSPELDWECLLQTLQPMAMEQLILPQPEAGQTSAGVPTSGAWGDYSAPGQPYLPNTPVQMPSSPGPGWECLLRTPQPMTIEELILPQPEAGQTSAGGLESGVSGNHPAPGQLYPNPNLQAQIASSSRLDWGASQPIAAEDIIQNDALPNPQPAVEARRRRKSRTKGLPSVKKRFLAGLDKYAQGVQLKDCSSSLNFSTYIRKDGRMLKNGLTLNTKLTAAEKALLDQAVASRKERLLDNRSIKDHFLAGLDRYAQGAKLKDCSATIQFRFYVSTDGRLHQPGRYLRATLSSQDQARLDQALIDRGRIITQHTSADVDQFRTTLKPYGEGLNLLQCGDQSGLKNKVFMYLTPKGGLTYKGKRLIENLQPDQQIDVWYAIEKRRQFLDPSAQVTVATAPNALIDAGLFGVSGTSLPNYDSAAVGADFQHQYGFEWTDTTESAGNRAQYADQYPGRGVQSSRYGEF